LRSVPARPPSRSARRGGRRAAASLGVALALMLAVAAAWAARFPVTRTVLLGHSVRGRPISADVVAGAGPARRTILVVGCIHGDECAGDAIVSALARTALPRGVRLWLVPALNPDGTAAGTRQNADGVDLNRNFPYLWQPIRDPIYDSGPRPLSEPETRAAVALILRIRPAVTIWFHQHEDLVNLSDGGDDGVPRRYAQLAGLPPACLPFTPGDASEWSNHALPATTAFVVELPAGPVSAAALAAHLRAVRAMERGERSGPRHGCPSSAAAAIRRRASPRGTTPALR
jgi:protein MpaA